MILSTKHHIFFTAMVLSWSESYAQCVGKTGIDTALSNDNVAAFLLIRKCFENHTVCGRCGDKSNAHSMYLHIVTVTITSHSQLACTFSGHSTLLNTTQKYTCH